MNRAIEAILVWSVMMLAWDACALLLLGDYATPFVGVLIGMIGGAVAAVIAERVTRQ